MDIKNKVNGATGKFVIQEHGGIFAGLDYDLKDGKIMLITHTEVDDTLEGQGIGGQLVSAAADYARQNSFTIKASCSFAKAVLDKSPEYADIYTS